MRLSDQAVREYIQLYKADFGEEVTLEEGREIATRLLALYRIFSKPVPAKRPMLPDGPVELNLLRPLVPPPLDHTAH